MEIRLTIKILPSGEEVDIDLPITSTPKEIIAELIRHNLAPASDSSGNEINYSLSGNNRALGEDETIEEAGLKEGDSLLMIPKIVAGGGSTLSERRKGKLVYRIPNEICVGNKERIDIRISKSGLQDFLLTKGLVEKSEINKIEIGKLMKVTIEENSIKKGLEIVPLTNEEQLITKENYTEWIFNVLPTRIGLSSILMKVSLIKHLKDIGLKEKVVFLFEQEIDVITAHSNRISLNDKTHEFAEIEEVTNWNKEKNDLVIEHISKNDTGKAISILANHFQDFKQFQSSIITLKAQYNHGKNLSNLNLIEQSKWWMIQSKINYSVLQLVGQIKENSKEFTFENHEEINGMLNELK